MAALLGAAGSLSAHAMAEADEALAPKVRERYSRRAKRVGSAAGLVWSSAGAARHARTPVRLCVCSHDARGRHRLVRPADSHNSQVRQPPTMELTQLLLLLLLAPAEVHV